MHDPDAEAAPHPQAYRAYKLGTDSRIFGVEIVGAADDAGAVTLAQVLTTRFAVELWDQARLIGRLKPATA